MKYGESVVVEMEPDLELAEQAVSAGDITSSLVVIAEKTKPKFETNTNIYCDIARDVRAWTSVTDGLLCARKCVVLSLKLTHLYTAECVCVLRFKFPVHFISRIVAWLSELRVDPNQSIESLRNFGSKNRANYSQQ